MNKNELEQLAESNGGQPPVVAVVDASKPIEPAAVVSVSPVQTTGSLVNAPAPSYSYEENSLDVPETNVQYSAPDNFKDLTPAQSQFSLVYRSHVRAVIIAFVLVILVALGGGIWQMVANKQAAPTVSDKPVAAPANVGATILNNSSTTLLTVNGSLQVMNGTNLQTLEVLSDARIRGNLMVDGNGVFGSDVSANTIRGNSLVIGGNSIVLGTLQAGNVSGSFSGSYVGDGSGLRDIDAAIFAGKTLAYFEDASHLLTGTVSDARLSGNVALKGSANIFSATNTFSSDLLVQGTAVFASGVAAASFSQNGYEVCDASGNCGGAVVDSFNQGGNAFSATALLGTTDTQSLVFQTDGTSRLTIAAGGAVTVAGSLTAASLSGNGSGLTNLNANSVITGELSDSILSTNVVFRNTSNTFTGTNTFTGVGNSFSGDGSGLAGVDAALLGGQDGNYYRNASSINAGALDNARLSSAVTLQGNSFNGSNQLVQLLATGALPALNGSNVSNVNATALQGYAASYFTDASNLTSGTVSDTRLSSNVVFLNASNVFTGTSNDFGALSATSILQNGNAVCDMSGNCAGAGGGIVGGGTSGTVALFTGAGSIGNSIISQASTTITVAGTLSAVALQGDGAGITGLNADELTSGVALVGVGGTGATAFTDNGIIFGGGNAALRATAVGQTGQCLVGNTGGAPSFASCASAAEGAAPGGSAGGDLSGSYPNPTVTGLNGTALSIAGLTSGDFLLYNGSNWVNTAISGDITAANDGALTIANGVVSNAKLTNSSLTVSAGSGLSGGGSVSLGSSTSLAVVYGSASGTAVEGDTTLICPSGTGNLSGGGNTITLGAGGSCGNLTITDNPSFTSLTLSNALTIANGGTAATTAAGARSNLGAAASGANSDITSLAGVDSVGSTGQGLALQGNASTVISATTGSFTTTLGFATPTANVTYTLPTAAAGSYGICTTIGNCAGAGGGVVGSGVTDTIALFTASGSIGNSIMTQSGTTVSVAGTLTATTLQGSGAAITNLNGTNIASGTVGVSVGGTGAGSFTTNGIVYGNGTGALQVTAAGVNGECLTGATGGAPVWVSCTSASGGAAPGGAAGGDLSGSYPNPTVVALYGTPLSMASLTAGNILIYDGTSWTNAAVSGDVVVSTAGVATIQNGVVTNAKLANSSLTVTAGTGLSGGGSVSLGGSTTLAVSYGNSAGTAAQGNTSLSFSGTGNLTGGLSGTAGGGFSTNTLAVVSNPNFSGLLSANGGLDATNIGFSGALMQSGTGVITLGSLSTGIVQTNASGIVSSGSLSRNSSNLTGQTDVANGGTGATTAAGARSNLGAAASGSNSDITSLSGTTSVGSVGQVLTLQGNASTSLAASGGGFMTTVSFATPSANVVYRFPATIAGTYDICSSVGNCAGAGGGIVGTGTANTIALFTGSGTIADSILSQSSSTITVAGTLNATTINQNGNQVCDVSGNCGYAAGSGSNSYIQNQFASAQSGNLWISGTAQAVAIVADNINSTGALQTNGVTRITSVGDLQNVTADAGIITTGTLSDARLSTTVSLDRGTIANNADLNTLTSQGTYRAGGSTYANFPSGAYTFGTLVVSTSGGLSVTQNYHPHNVAGSWTRTKWNANDWTVWQKVYSDSNDGTGSGLDADLLDGNNSAFFQDAANLTTGTLLGARLSGSYTGITAVGTLTSLTASGAITSTVATGTAPLVVASITKVTNLNADLFDGLDSSAFAAGSGSGNYIQNQSASVQTANMNISGSGYFGGSVGIGTATPGQKLDVQGGSINTSGALMTGGVTRIDGNGNVTANLLQINNNFPLYSVLLGGGTDLNWKTMATVTAPVGLYTGASFEVNVTDAYCNFGCSANEAAFKYYVSVLRSAGFQDDTLAATISGPVNEYVRVVKINNSTYEIQGRSNFSYRHTAYKVQATSMNNTSVAYSNNPVDGSTTGTIYTPQVIHTDNVTNLQAAGNINVAGNTVVGGTLSVGVRDSTNTYSVLDGLRISGDDTTNTIWNDGKAIVISANAGSNIGLCATSNCANGLTVQTATGNVGIGVTSPNYKLEVNGVLGFTTSGSYRQAVSPTSFGYNASWKAIMLGSTSTAYNAANGAVTLSFGYDPSGNLSANYQGDGSELLFRNGAKFLTPNAANTDFLQTIALKDGNLGVGKTDPSQRLDVSGNILATGTLTAGTGQGFRNVSFAGGYNPIWSFGSAPSYGMGYYQVGSDVLGIGQDAIGFNFGSTTTSPFYVKADGAVVSSSNVRGTTLTASVVTGTAPLTVTSTTKVTNLNVDSLDGYDSSGFVLDMVDADNITGRVDTGFYQTSTATIAEGYPVDSNGWYHLLSNTHSNAGNNFAMQFSGSFYNSNDVFYRATNNSGSTAWNRIWHQGNDGSTSGLDADTIDGLDSTAFMLSGGSGSFIQNGTSVQSGANFNIAGTGTIGGALNVAGVSTLAGELDVTGGSGTNYASAPIEIRTTAIPRIAFHWPGVVASQLGMDSSGLVRTFNNPGTGYERFGSLSYEIQGTTVIDSSRNVVNANNGTFAGNLSAGGYARATGELQSTSANALRMIQGNYGAMLRNDGADTYFLLTASADQYGGWNSLRPLQVNNASGSVGIGSNTLYVQHGGNVGIGTTSPGAKLAVSNSSALTDALVVKQMLPEISYYSTFAKTWNTTAQVDVINASAKTTDSGFVVTGQTDGQDMYIAKYNAVGALEWDTTWNAMSGGTDIGAAIVQTSDGGYAVAGYGSSSSGTFIAKFNATGAHLWTRINTNYSTSPTAIAELSDGGLVTQQNYTNGSGYGNIFMWKVTSTGTGVWGRSFYNFSSTTYGRSLTATSDGGFISAGQVIVSKFDSAGVLIWSKHLDVSSSSIESAIQASDGSYVVAGYVSAAGVSSPWITKLDTSGNVTWSKTWSLTGSVNSAGYGLAEAADGGYVVASGSGGTTTHLIKFDSTASNIVWAKSWTYSTSIAGRTLSRTTDGGYFVGGSVSDSSLLLKFGPSGDMNGCSTMCQNITGSFTSLTPTVTTMTTSFNPFASSVNTHSPNISSPTNTEVVIVATASNSVAGAVSLRTNLQLAATGNLCLGIENCVSKLGVNGNITASSSITANGTPDIAEYIPAAPDVEAADVVMADPDNTERVVKANGVYSRAAVGVISDGTSSFIINPYGNVAGTPKRTDIKPLVLAGRVPVKISGEGGPVMPGDDLTTSSTPGYAMKATRAGPTIGKALGFFSGTTIDDQGQVLALINSSYYNSEVDSLQGSDLALSGNGTIEGSLIVGADLNVGGHAILGSLAVTGNAAVGGNLNVEGNLTVSGLVNVQDITINGHIITAGETPTTLLNSAFNAANVTVSIEGNDTTGTVTISTRNQLFNDPDWASNVDMSDGTSMVQLNFNKQFGANPRVLLSPSNANAAKLGMFTDDVSQDSFKVNVNELPAAGKSYRFTYWVAQ